MSRNLGDTSCRICPTPDTIVLEEDARPITEAEAGAYWLEYEGRLDIANAHCNHCGAKYLAWVRQALPGNHIREPYSTGKPFVDLSFRRSFNDEPAPEDLPSKDMLTRIHYVQCMEIARRYQADAKALIDEAESFIKRATEDESHWEKYR